MTGKNSCHSERKRKNLQFQTPHSSLLTPHPSPLTPHSKPHTPHSAQQIQLKYREIIIENAQVFLVDKFSLMGYNLRVIL